MRHIEASDHCPRCGSGAFPLRGATRRVCDSCGHSHFFNPITAVGALILDEGGRVLLIRRGHEPGKGLLGCPGGFVDGDETLEEAIIREVREEVGLALDDLRYFCSHPNEYEYSGIVRSVIDVFFTGRVDDFNVVMQAGEVDDWSLVPLDEIRRDQICFESQRVALERLRAERA